jgi:SAM-dependent methyltransferase
VPYQATFALSVGCLVGGCWRFVNTVAVFSDADSAALYDVLYPWDPQLWPSDGSYYESVMAAGSVLDVGCGTGSMLHRAREQGHTGRLVGLDPNRAALARARRRIDIEIFGGRTSRS